MNPLYNAGLYLFKYGLAAASLRSPKIREMRKGQRQTLDTLAERRRSVAPDGFDVWIHAASLGEFEQGRPLIERLRRERPDIRILLTFFSPSGYNVRHNYDKVDAVAYLPLDTPAEVRAFLDAAAPRCAIFVKYEFWGNYLAELQRREIPVYSISAIFRPGQRFFRPCGELFRRMLRCFTHFYVQDEASKKLLHSIGIDKVTVAGDTRFDRVTDVLRESRPLTPELEAFASSSDFTVVAGSTWPADEDVLIPELQRLGNVKAIIAPHEFDDRRLEKLLQRCGEGACLLSRLGRDGNDPAKCRTVIVDCFGLLSTLYRCASVAYVGGGFGSGIHNINEAAVYGVPVIFGPKHQKFREAAGLAAAGGGFEVTDRESLGKVLDTLISDKTALAGAGRAAGAYISRNIGATDIIFKDLFTSSK